MRFLGSIRSRLLLAFVFIVLFSVLGVSTLMIALGARNADRQVVAQLESVATLKEAEIEAWVDGLRMNLDLVLSGDNVLKDITLLQNGRTPASSRNAAEDQLRRRFAWAAERMELFDELFLMDPDGHVLISTVPQTEGERHSLYDYFVEGLEGYYVQEPSYSLSLQKMTVMASAPITRGGHVLGVLAGRASLNSLNAVMLQRAGLGDTGETYLVGSNRRLLTSLRDELQTPQEMYISSPAVDRLLEQQEPGSLTYRNYGDDEVIGVYRWLPELQVGLIAEQGRYEALAGTRLMLTTVAGVALLAVCLAIAAAVYLTRTIVRPVAELAQTATEIADGDLERRASIVRHDEVGTLAEAFNRMAGRLGNLVGDLEQRTDQLRTINEVGRQMSSLLHLDELLPYVSSCLQERFGYRDVAVLLVDPNSGALTRRARLSFDPENSTSDQEVWGLAEAAARSAEVQIGCGVRPGWAGNSGAAAGATHPTDSPGAVAPPLPAEELAELAVPISIQDRVVGVLHIRADRGRSFEELDLFTARTLADQLAVAIQNSELYEKAEELATVQERQRLARDLHDAVSQTLFSACLIAEVLPRLWAKSPGEGERRLEDLRRLTKGALGEMRMLLLELRPEALRDAAFDELLRHLTDAFACSAGLPAALEVEGTATLPADVQVVFYRVAQEALSNVQKHAQADEVTLRCQLDESHAKLVIEDNGVGFDPGAVGGGHFGLRIMAERAASVGAKLDLYTTPEGGTTLTLSWTAERLSGIPENLRA